MYTAMGFFFLKLTLKLGFGDKQLKCVQNCANFLKKSVNSTLSMENLVECKSKKNQFFHQEHIWINPVDFEIKCENMDVENYPMVKQSV